HLARAFFRPDFLLHIARHHIQLCHRDRRAGDTEEHLPIAADALDRESSHRVGENRLVQTHRPRWGDVAITIPVDLLIARRWAPLTSNPRAHLIQTHFSAGSRLALRVDDPAFD